MDARGGWRRSCGFRVALMASPSGDRQAEVAVDRAREVDDELAVVGGDRRGGTRRAGLRRRAGDVRAVAGVLRAVARAEEAVREAQRLAARPSVVSGCDSASARTVQPRCVQTAEIAWKVVALAEDEEPLVGEELAARPGTRSAGRASPWWARRRRRSGTSERSEATAWAPSAATPAPIPSFRRNSRRSLLIARAPSRPRCEPLRDREPLHRHRVGRAADGAEPAADAAVVVLDHRGERQAVRLGARRERGALRPPAGRARRRARCARQYSGQTSTQRLQRTHFSGS